MSESVDLAQSYRHGVTAEQAIDSVWNDFKGDKWSFIVAIRIGKSIVHALLAIATAINGLQEQKERVYREQG